MKVGVPVVPGTPGPVDTYSDGDAFIKEHGFPGAFFFARLIAQVLTMFVQSSSKQPWVAVDVVCVS